MGYYNTSYEPKATDVLCAFRIVPQDTVGSDSSRGRGGGRVLDRDLDRGMDRPAYAA